MGRGGGGLLPSTSERFPEGMQNILKTSVADPNQFFFPSQTLCLTATYGNFFQLINSAVNWS